MNDCGDYRSNIPFYLDGELSGHELENLRAHLRECADCRTLVDQEQSLSHLLRQSRPLYPAPQALRDRVSRVIQAEESGDIYVPGQMRRRIAQFFLRPLRNAAQPALYWKLSTVGVLLLVMAFIFVPFFVQRARATAFVDAAVATHRNYLEGNLPLEVQTESPAVVTGWFKGKVPFHFQLPASQQVQSGGQTYRLTGARLVNYKGNYAALTTYEMQGKTISLLVASSKSAVAAGGEEVQSGDLTFHYYGVNGLKVITWSNHGLTYALVSSISNSARESCLVCHQNMADRENFAHHP
jgi:mycothiol system anti-sigma-R factor